MITMIVAIIKILVVNSIYCIHNISTMIGTREYGICCMNIHIILQGENKNTSIIARIHYSLIRINNC